MLGRVASHTVYWVFRSLVLVVSGVKGQLRLENFVFGGFPDG